MRTISIHHGEWEKSHLVYAHLKERVSEHLNTLYRRIKASAETEDIVVVLWAVLLVGLTYISYIRFSECGKIIGLYVQTRF
jgi:hypothetical protein